MSVEEEALRKVKVEGLECRGFLVHNLECLMVKVVWVVR